MRITEHPVLEFQHGQEVEFTFEGRTLVGTEGEPIAAALHANGVRELREHHGRPRGFFCAIGNCSSCLMEVDGVPNVRVCVEPLKSGMVVKLQQGNGSLMGGSMT
ncbi:(2Fe-2S)-binding protein [Butyricicoccus faecihominis]|uniref:(2Fe-2S)-binding protein n=1 Tax=Butyricicoccaceae TaxID=3085642 RepID=UPI00247A83A8|nr:MULTISPECIES: (2Fe-2S)-binding protein [Butyricicoccaceae]MCQ5128101.1 (2Fe-2S)-binding protein [Butyricicoccus faecihominis]WNX86406.1 (2Fe-2S)-binding protein [Agathobaculum sp. NTUH-O15-33]